MEPMKFWFWVLKFVLRFANKMKLSGYFFQAGREIRQYFHSAEWTTALCNYEGGWQEGADRRVRTWRLDWSGKDHERQIVDSRGKTMNNFSVRTLSKIWLVIFFFFIIVNKCHVQSLNQQ